MKKLILTLLACILLQSVAFAETADITLTVDIDKMLIVATKHLGEIPLKDEKEWKDKKTPEYEYTNKEYVEKYFVEYCGLTQINRFNKAIAAEAAKTALIKDTTSVSLKRN